MREKNERHHIAIRRASTGLALVLGLLGSGCASLDTGARARAEAAYEAGRYEEAAQAYEALASQGNAQDWYRLGNAYARSGRLVEASDAYRRALALQPEFPQARHNLAMTYLQLGVRGVLEARRGLPEVDAEAAATMRYLACVMETFMGYPDPPTCNPSQTEER